MTDDHAIARLAAELTRLEASPATAVEAFARLDITRGKVTTVTGAPGAGKSSLLRRVLAVLASRGERVGAILVDPSSPVTGGAILGDRLRMLESNPEIFIRSVASPSGVESVGAVAPVMAWTLLNEGFDHVFIESVGIGQQELDVGNRGDVLAVVLGPGSGDWVQFMKCGILDLCDLIAVTKADLGTREIVAEIEQTVRLQSFRCTPVPVMPVSSHSGDGIEALIEAIDAAHAVSASRRSELRAGVVRDVLSRIVLDETRRHLDDVFDEAPFGDWRRQVEQSKAFLASLRDGRERGGIRSPRTGGRPPRSLRAEDGEARPGPTE